ncbi:MAG: phytanoyl-CoA dioxygenase family protein [Fimbriimonadaceae bacterium]|nr:phytanoyl-CoA dioxygenase family protein [Fimbriimonadaceae bacterium]
MAVTLNAEQLEQFQRDGYVILEDVFDAATLQDLDQSLQGFFEQHRQALEADGGESGISRANEILFTDHIAEKAPDIRHFVTRPEFVEIATQLIGPDVDLYWNQTVYKQPEGTREFPWHQDDGYTRVNPSPYLTLWLAINDATLENGCISVLPGSHHRGFVPHQPSSIGWVCHSSDDPDQGVPVPLKAGSIAAFQSLTMHKSGANRSQGMRKAYVIQYCAAGTTYLDSGEPVPVDIPLARNGQPA